MNRYPAGANVLVHHMPSDPSVSLLEPGVKPQAWFVPGLGLVFVCVGILLLFLSPRLLPKTDQSSERDAASSA